MDLLNVAADLARGLQMLLLMGSDFFLLAFSAFLRNRHAASVWPMNLTFTLAGLAETSDLCLPRHKEVLLSVM